MVNIHAGNISFYRKDIITILYLIRSFLSRYKVVTFRHVARISFQGEGGT